MSQSRRDALHEQFVDAGRTEYRASVLLLVFTALDLTNADPQVAGSPSRNGAVDILITSPSAPPEKRKEDILRRITGVGASLMILTSLAVASPPAASAAESDLIKLEDTNIELLEQLSPEDHCLWNKTVYPAGGTGYADNSLPYDGMDATKAAVLVVRAEALRDNMGSVVGVEAIGQGEVSSLQILVDEASADARTSADLLSKSP